MSQTRDQQRFTILEVAADWRQLIGMSQWYRSALCGHPLLTLADNWTLLLIIIIIIHYTYRHCCTTVANIS